MSCSEQGEKGGYGVGVQLGVRFAGRALGQSESTRLIAGMACISATVEAGLSSLVSA